MPFVMETACGDEGAGGTVPLEGFTSTKGSEGDAVQFRMPVPVFPTRKSCGALGQRYDTFCGVTCNWDVPVPGVGIMLGCVGEGVGLGVGVGAPPNGVLVGTGVGSDP